MNIWCLFSIANEYDQPRNNLVVWWKEQPPFEVLLKAIGGSLKNQDSILVAANILQGHEAKFETVSFRLEVVTEGIEKE